MVSKLIGLVLLLTVGVGFYITLFTVVLRYEETAEQYFIDHAYADITIHGVFDDGDVSFISGLDGVILARGRNVRDFREGERIFRAISLTDGINIPYIYEGRPPQNKSEIMLLNRNANAMGLHLGDTLTLGNRNLLITGLAASPEYIYLVQSERNPMAQAGSFGVIFVTAEFFGEGYNEIVALTNGNVIPEGFNVITRGDQANYNLYREDLSQIRSFAFIFPLVFAVLISVVIYVTLSRTIQKDRRKIGIMKALGVFDEKIIVMYLTRFCVAALVGAFLGGVGAIVLSDFIIGIFSSMFEVPTLSFVFYPVLWLSAFVIAVLLCVVSGLVALFPILSLLPAHAMRPRIPKGGSRLPIEQTFLWKRLSFNTRYALKNSFRNKGRFFAVILGMCGSCALLVFSLGFYDSIINTRDRYFNEFANYDVIISFDPMPLSVPHPALESLDESQKALVMPVEILGSNYILAIVDYDFDMLNIPREALQNGVIIPKFFAEKWDTGVGEILQINDHKAEISAVIPQYLGLMLFVGGTPPMYNTIYGRSTDMAALTTFLIENNISFSTIDDDKTSFYSVMESMSVLILFMIACSVILGFTVLYSVGMINLSAREYEYMFMGVMGYPHSKILAAHIKETVVQLVLAIPLGFILGYFLLESIKDVFSGEAFVISAAIFPRSYFIAALKVIGVTALMGFITSRHIKKLDIVEGLKAIDTV